MAARKFNAVKCLYLHESKFEFLYKISGLRSSCLILKSDLMTSSTADSGKKVMGTLCLYFENCFKMPIKFI